MPGFSKERRLEPQITIGLLTNATGFPLAVQATLPPSGASFTATPSVRICCCASWATLCVSNVPGPRGPVSVLGVPVLSLSGLAEIGQRHALRVAAVSLGDEMSLGFCADPSIVRGVRLMAAAAATEAMDLISAG